MAVGVHRGDYSSLEGPPANWDGRVIREQFVAAGPVGRFSYYEES